MHIEFDKSNQMKLKEIAVEEKDKLCAELTANHEQLVKLRLQISEMHSERVQVNDSLSKVFSS